MSQQWYFTPDYSVGAQGVSTYAVLGDMIDNAVKLKKPFDLMGASNELGVITNRERKWFDALCNLRTAVMSVAYCSDVSLVGRYCHVELRDDTRVVFQMDIMSNHLSNGMITMTRALALYDITHMSTNMSVHIQLPTTWAPSATFNANSTFGLQTPFPGITTTTTTNYKSFNTSTKTLIVSLGQNSQTTATLGKVVVPAAAASGLDMKSLFQSLTQMLKNIKC